MADNDDRELKTIKFQMMLSPSEAEQIDEWMFKRRIKSRAEAIRRMCQIAMLVSDNHQQLAEDILRMNDFLASRKENPEERSAESFMSNALPEIYSVLGRSLSIAAIAKEMESGGSLSEALERRSIIQKDIDKFIVDLQDLRNVRDAEHESKRKD